MNAGSKDMKLFSEIVLTSEEKACNIIQVVSERNAASDGEQLPGYSGRTSNGGLLREQGFEKHFKKVLDKNG
jgi:hypothetical protein